MKKIAMALAIVGMALIPVLNAAPVAAQTGSNPQTYLSGDGKDKGACQIDKPCLTLTYALTQTQAHGEVDVVDTWVSPNENVTITGSVFIHGNELQASFGATTGTALTINAGSGDNIGLHHLNIGGTATNGVVFNSGNTLTLIHTSVAGFSGVGLTFNPNTSGGSSKLIMAETSKVNGSGNGNILIRPVGSTNAHIEIRDSLIYEGGSFRVSIDTIAGTGGVSAVIVNSSMSNITVAFLL
jgi:hypothetical protein